MRIFLILIFLVLVGCNSFSFDPDATSIEYGTAENGKNKTTKTIKQTFKWKRIKKLISP